jgi:hypothetical protein
MTPLRASTKSPINSGLNRSYFDPQRVNPFGGNWSQGRERGGRVAPARAIHTAGGAREKLHRTILFWEEEAATTSLPRHDSPSIFVSGKNHCDPLFILVETPSSLVH